MCAHRTEDRPLILSVGQDHHVQLGRLLTAEGRPVKRMGRVVTSPHFFSKLCVLAQGYFILVRGEHLFLLLNNLKFEDLKNQNHDESGSEQRVVGRLRRPG